MELKKPKRELVRIAVNIDTMREIAEVDLESGGQTRDLSRRRHLSGLYNKRNNSLKELI